MEQRVDIYDYVRGIAIILVVIGHSIITTPVDMFELGWGGLKHFH